MGVLRRSERKGAKGLGGPHLILSAPHHQKQMIALQASDRSFVRPYLQILRSWFLGSGFGQQLFNFRSPAVHWMARTSSLNCLSCRNPYQTPLSLNPSPLFTEKPIFVTEKCFVGSPAQKSAPKISWLSRIAEHDGGTSWHQHVLF